ncbi:MAG: anthranilate phosphoribosyltransferase [Calditrichales bacterium]|nr:MAG: anthranilate phosphoribosyltransferase [Calditrichales bacterium]
MAEIIQKAINRLIEGKNLTRNESKRVMKIIMRGEATEAQISAFLVALRMKGETVEEVTGAVEAMKDDATHIKSTYKNIVDTCGTGGDSLNTFNISTAAAFVAAGAGVAVAKHGTRSVSSKCGSSDVLTALWVNIDIPPEMMEECLYEVGISFLFAKKLKTSMPYAMGPRMEIGARTIFNILGPLTNPARTKRQLVGVYEIKLVRLVVEVLKELGAVQTMAVHGLEGIDEISISGPTKVCEMVDGVIYEYQIRPENFKIQSAPLQAIQTNAASKNKKILLNVLKGEPSPALDVVLLNAGAAIKVSGKVNSLWDGVLLARESITSGNALDKLNKLKKFTNRVIV